MDLSKEQERRIQSLIDKCNKTDDDSLDIYEVMNTYKCYLDATDEVRDYIYEVVADSLGIGGYTLPIVYGYARVSTKSQEDNTSLDNQIKELCVNGATKVYPLWPASGPKQSSPGSPGWGRLPWGRSRQSPSARERSGGS